MVAHPNSGQDSESIPADSTGIVSGWIYNGGEYIFQIAGVVELVDALGSGPSELRFVGVRVPPPAFWFVSIFRGELHYTSFLFEFECWAQLRFVLSPS